MLLGVGGDFGRGRDFGGLPSDFGRDFGGLPILFGARPQDLRAFGQMGYARGWRGLDQMGYVRGWRGLDLGIAFARGWAVFVQVVGYARGFGVVGRGWAVVFRRVVGVRVVVLC